MKMKKIIALCLVAVLLMGVCSTAFAALPTVKFSSAAKNQKVRYGNTVNMKLKLNCGSYTRVKSKTGYIMRAGFTMVLSKGSKSAKVLDVDFTGKGTKVYSFRPSQFSAIKKPSKSDKYKVTLQAWYRPTKGYTVYAFQKAGSAKKTYLTLKK